MRRFALWFVLGFWLLFVSEASAQEDLQVLEGWKKHDIRWIEQTDARFSALKRLNARAYRLLDLRKEAVAQLQTAEDWKKRRSEVRNTLDELLGPWPAKSPLNALSVKILQRHGYWVELLTFESLPGFPVTAALYVPDHLTGPAPGILYIPGHATNGFRADHYQKFCLNLVNKGFVVLTFDPIGQGERFQNIDPETGEPFINTREFPPYKMHSYPGNQCYLAGVSIARYFIWDAIRGLDYLQSRPEVDGSRLGVTGNSGGGNQTAFVGALDDRVSVAVPSCWITSYRRLLEINGLQDAEQNIFNGLSRGIEHTDWLLARAPKPTMLMTTSHDFFPIQGVRETDRQARKIWSALGSPENFDRTEDDHGHGYTKKNSEAAYAFLMKHLGVEGSSEERDFPLFTEAEMQVTETGQVETAFEAETVFSLNRKETENLLSQLEESRKTSNHLAKVEARARELSGYQAPGALNDAVYRGGYQRDGYRIDKYGLSEDDGSIVPVLLFQPDSPGPHPAIVVVHPQGKLVHAEQGGLIEKLVLEDRIVAAIDVANTGETEMPIGRVNDHNILFYTAMMSGNSVVALQAADLVLTAQWLKDQDDVLGASIGLLAFGDTGPSALHAAAFAEDFQWLALVDSPVDYASMVMNRRYRHSSDCMVAGALTAYDLPDLLAVLAPKKVALLSPVSEDQEKVGLADTEEMLKYPLKHYKQTGAGSRLRIQEGGIKDIPALIDWCFSGD
ncbi:MAG: acetylxylan esterase [Verrucomicrobiae bacterium]|nr:acetylxylan esterase [Verrucomicrobiae bacterium]